MNGSVIADASGARHRFLVGTCALVLLVLGLCASLLAATPSRAYANTSIEGATVTVTPDQAIYDGSAQGPAMTVMLGGTDISESCDPVYYNNAQCREEDRVDEMKNVGTYYVRATAKAGSEYTGTTDGHATFDISEAPASATATPSPFTVTFGDAGTITVSAASGQIGDVELVTASTDGIVSFFKSGKTITVTPLKVGTTTATIKVLADPSGNYGKPADVIVGVTAAPVDLSKAKVADIPQQTYTGSPLEPPVTVTYGNATLVKDKDYTTSYTNNVNPGAQAQVTIKAKAGGNCSGEVVKTFSIVEPPAPTPSQDNWKITPYATVNGTEKAKAKLTNGTTPTLTMTYDGHKHGIAVSTNIAGAVVTYNPNTTIRDAGHLTVGYTASDPSGVNITKTGNVKLVIEPLKTLKAKVDSGTVTLEGDATFGKLSHGGKIMSMTVDEVSASNDRDDKSYVSKLKATYASSNSSDEFKVYDVSLVRHTVGESVKKGTKLYDDFGKVKISFPLGKKYAGKTAHVVELHEQRNSSGKVTGTKAINLGNSLTVAKDGTVTVTVDKLSDFAVALGKGSSSNSNSTRGASSSNAAASGKSAKTGDNLRCVGPLTALAAVSLALSGIAYARLRRLRS